MSIDKLSCFIWSWTDSFSFKVFWPKESVDEFTLPCSQPFGPPTVLSVVSHTQPTCLMTSVTTTGLPRLRHSDVSVASNGLFYHKQTNKQYKIAAGSQLLICSMTNESLMNLPLTCPRKVQKKTFNYLARESLTDFPAAECLSVSAHHDWHVPRSYVQALKC